MKESKLEKQAGVLWQTFEQTPPQKFWTDYDALRQKSKNKRPSFVSVYTPEPVPVQAPKPKPYVSPYRVKQVPFLKRVARKIPHEFLNKKLITFLVLALLFVVVLSYWTNIGDRLTNAWAGYRANTLLQTDPDSLKSEQLIILKFNEFTIKEHLDYLGGKITSGGYKVNYEYVNPRYERLLNLYWRGKKTHEDVLKQWLVKKQQFAEAYQKYQQTQARTEQKKDTLFGKRTPTQRRRLDSMYVHSQQHGYAITPERISHYLQVGGGVNGCKSPYNLSKHNKAVYDLFMPGDTCVFFMKNKKRELLRIRFLKGHFYKISLVGGVEKINPDLQNIYKANLSLVYTKDDYPVMISSTGGVYYQMKSEVTFINQTKRERVKTKLKVALYKHEK